MDPFADIELPEAHSAVDLDPTPGEHRADDLYKKWFRTKSLSGFCAIKPWFEALKVSIDIGEVDVHTNKAKSHTLVWVDMIALCAWLRRNTTEDFQVYGGAHLDGQPVSRMFSIRSDHAGGFFWATTHFAAKASATGAFVPSATKLSANQIKMRPPEHAEIQLRLELALSGWAARTPEWYSTRK